MVAPTICDTLHEKSQLRSIEFIKIGREQNKVVHEITYHALVSSDCRVWFAEFPKCFMALTCKDIT